MKLAWSARAREDLRDIHRYIALDDPRAARRWVARLREKIKMACSVPRVGRIVPEYEDDLLREMIEGTYRIIYTITPTTIYVVTVLEGHRLLRPEDVSR